MAGKVTVGLASHWPCVTDSVVYSPYVLNGLEKGDEHLEYAPLECGSFILHNYGSGEINLVACVLIS